MPDHPDEPRADKEATKIADVINLARDQVAVDQAHQLIDNYILQKWKDPPKGLTPVAANSLAQEDSLATRLYKLRAVQSRDALREVPGTVSSPD